MTTRLLVVWIVVAYTLSRLACLLERDERRRRRQARIRIIRQQRRAATVTPAPSVAYVRGLLPPRRTATLVAHNADTEAE